MVIIVWRAVCTGITAAALSLAVVAGCHDLEDPTTATNSQLVVHAVLDTESPIQTILVSRARTGTRRSDFHIGDDDAVPGGTVTITAPNGAVMVASESNASAPLNGTPGAYFITPSQYGVDLRTGGTYSLNVRTPLDEFVTGTTTLPASAPQGSFGYVMGRGDSLGLHWAPVPGARSYEVVLRSSSADYRIFTDTVIALKGTTLTIQGDEVFPQNSTVDVAISAVDSNYYDYYRAQSDPFAGAAPSHLTGAVGVFGSVAPILYGRVVVR